MSEQQTYHRRIASATVVVGFFVLVSRLGMLAREVALSWKYGASDIVDAYQIALTVSTWLPLALVSVLGIVLVPAFVELQRGPLAPRQTFFAEVNGLAVAAGFAVLLASLVGLPWVATAMTATLPPSTQAAAATMTREIAPVAGMMIVASVLSCRLMARERHVNTLLEALPALAICIAAIAWRAEVSGEDLVVGLLVGTAAQLGWLALLVARDSDGIARPRLQFASERWRAVRHAMSVMIVGTLVMALMTPVEQFFAARLGEGSVAILGYANRIFTLIASLGALAIGRGVLPVLADVSARADDVRARAIARHWAWMMGAAGAAVLLAGWFVTPYVVVLLFERGAFAHDDSVAVAEAVRWGLVQFPFYFAGIVLVQLLVVRGHYRLLALAGIANLLVKVASTYILAEAFGVPGITLATGVMYVFSCAVLVLAVAANPAR